MLAKLLLPKIAGPLMGALAALLIIGAGYHWWTVDTLEDTIADQETTIAKAERDLERSRNNVSTLEADLEKQNSAMAAVEAELAAAEDQNQRRVEQVRERWEAERRALTRIETVDEARAWFEQQYSRR